MSRFPRYLRRQHEAHDRANVDRATRDTRPEDDGRTYTTTLAGDTRKLRGIPAIARGVPGAIPGTSPHHTHR